MIAHKSYLANSLLSIYKCSASPPIRLFILL
jgi:hypothetical protein